MTERLSSTNQSTIDTNELRRKIIEDEQLSPEELAFLRDAVDGQFPIEETEDA